MDLDEGLALLGHQPLFATRLGACVVVEERAAGGEQQGIFFVGQFGRGPVLDSREESLASQHAALVQVGGSRVIGAGARPLQAGYAVVLEFGFGDIEPSKERVPHKCTEIQSKGSLVVFPSFTWHRVCPVKSGTRYSLVIWSLGWPFK